MFQGVSAYLEPLIRRVATPSLKELESLFLEEAYFFRLTSLAVYEHSRGPRVRLCPGPALS